MDKNVEKIKANITKDDLIVCECGENLFTQVSLVAVIKSPIIGQPPVATSQPQGFKCSSCGKILDQDAINKHIGRKDESKAVLL